jgi:transposase
MSQLSRRTYSAEFKLEASKLVLDDNYSVQEAATAMNVGLSTMNRWVKQLKKERQGISPKASPMTSEHIEIRELKKELKRLHRENEILKKASVLLMSDAWKNQL